MDVIEVGSDDTEVLAQVLSDYPPPSDTMRSSPAYFQLTGRKGLWVLAEKGQKVIACLHPNVDGHALVFYLGLEINTELVRKACLWLTDKELAVEVARVDGRNVEVLSRQPGFHETEERVLDWRFPSTILDNAALAEAAGGQFARLRQKRNKLSNADIQVYESDKHDIRQLRGRIASLVEGWANAVAKSQDFSVEHLKSSNLYALKMLDSGQPNFGATVFALAGKVVGFYTTEFPQSGQIANGITLSIDRRLAGISEYAYWWCADNHMRRGYAFTHINGAETASLESFRRKLAPSDRIALKTFSFATH